MKKRVLILLVTFILLSLWSVAAQSNQTGQTVVCTDPKKFNWFIQIDISEHSSAECILKYSDEERKIRINSDMTLDGNAGSCLDKAYGGYWLKIKDSCLDKKFSISCDKSFISALAYNSAGSETIYVSSLTHSADSGGTTNEEVSEICEIKGPIGGNGTLPDSDKSCVSSGYYCRDREECLDDNGNVLGGYNCPEGKSCCNTREKEETCEEKRGSICAANQRCTGRSEETLNEKCCIGGVCENVDVANRCEEENSGSCKSSCADNEKEIDEDCPDSGDKCCKKEETDNNGAGISPIFIIILFVLIFLVVLGIIYRHKLQIWWYSRKAGGAAGRGAVGGGVPPRGPGPGGPPRAFGGMPQMRQRYAPPGMPRGPGPALRQTRGVKTQADKEMEETMRKLKEMGK